MMQAVGMTGKQLEQMLTMEGIWYGVWTLGIAATVGNVVSRRSCGSRFRFSRRCLPPWELK